MTGGVRGWDRWIPAEVHTRVGRLVKPVGSFGYDPWGYDTAAVKRVLAIVSWLYDHYFHVETLGLERVPAAGRLLIVPNHSGALPLDAVLLACAMMRNDAAPRAPRAVMGRSVPTLPWLGRLLSGIGGVTGDSLNCAKLFAFEEAVMVFPEGLRAGEKRYRERYALQAFDSRFVHLAIQHRVPVLPVGIVGCEDALPALLDLRWPGRRRRRLALPPPLPLPARIVISVGEPLCFPEQLQSEAAIAAAVVQVRERIAALVQQGLAQRRGVYR